LNSSVTISFSRRTLLLGVSQS